MTEDVKQCLDETKSSMQKALSHLEKELQKLRTGKANPQMLEGIKVDYYGSEVPLNQVSNVSSPDPKTITIQPWEKGMIQPIEKAIQAANLGFNPQNDGTIIRIPVPPLTEERRKDIVKRVKEYAEDTKVGIRSARKTGNDIAKMLEKEGVPEDEVKRLEADIQKLTNDFTEKAEKLAEAKENDLMKL